MVLFRNILAGALVLLLSSCGFGTFEALFGPSITSLDIDSGPIVGGTNITVTGENFVADAQVTLGDTDCVNVEVVSETSITCTTPAHAEGEVDVKVTNPDGNFGTLASGFSYQGPPTITAVSPSAGAIAGGTTITLTGTNFRNGATVSMGGSISNGGTECTSVSVASPTSLTCVTPARGAGTVGINIENLDTQAGSLSSAYTYRGAPTVSSVSPTAGALGGNTLVTISGSGYASSVSVTVGGEACTSVEVLSSVSVRCRTSAHAAGAVTASVTNTVDGQTGTGGTYTYQPAPTVTSLSPNSGIQAGGYSVTITGTGFIADATVTIAGQPCTSPNVTSATSMTCTVPEHAAGAEDVVVTNTDSQSGTLEDGFTYNAAPTPLSVFPSGGAIAGGTTVVITGTGFDATSTVDIDGPCSVVGTPTATTIVCTTQVTTHTTGSKNVVVTNSDTQAGTLTSGYRYQDSPVVDTVTASSGPDDGGTSITIAGSNFLTKATVVIGGVVCGSPTVSSNSITCTTNANTAGKYDVFVFNTDGQFGTKASAFTYLGDAPTITDRSPTSGPENGGTRLTITGTNFVRGTTVAVGGSNCGSLTLLSSTSIECTVPAGTGSPSVVVTNPDEQTDSTTFTYVGAGPAISNISPNFGGASAEVAITITGKNFTGATSVTLQGSEISNMSVDSATSITGNAPVGSVGDADLVVTTPSGSATLEDAFAYTANPAPTLTLISPNFGPQAGPQIGATSTVTLTGTNFINTPSAPTIFFGTAPCSSVTFVSATTLRCIPPPGAAGNSSTTVAVKVVNADNQETSTQNYTYHPPPKVLSASKSVSSTAGGESIVLGGSGFLAGATVTFKAALESGTVVTPTSIDTTNQLITCTIPAHASGAVDIIVTNLDGQTGTLTGSFTYGTGPTLSGIDREGGPLGGGDTVVLTGLNFVNGADVFFSGTEATSVTFNSATSLTVTTPARSAGTAAVVVTNPDGLSSTQSVSYTYRNRPSVTQISPTGGPVAGGTVVTITGSGFLGSTVNIDGNCPVIGTHTDDEITCTVAANAAGAVNVVVTNSDGQASIAPFTTYTFRDAPSFGGLSRAFGPLTGNSPITITGANFLGSRVTFDGQLCTSLTVNNPGSITCTPPNHAFGPVQVVIINSDEQQGASSSNAFTYQRAPTVTSLSKASGSPSGGTSVTVRGTDLLSAATVTFGGVDCSVTSNTNPSVQISETPSTSSLVCSTGAKTQDDDAVSVVLTNADGQSGTLASAYVYGSVDTWTTMATTDPDLPSARYEHTAVWTGSTGNASTENRMIVWGGTSNGSAMLNTGGVYQPSTDSWEDTSTSGVPTARFRHAAIWTGSEMIVWGGVNSSGTRLNTGSLYDPLADTWSAMTTTNPPTARAHPGAVWTGSTGNAATENRMIIWGGTNSSGSCLDNGAIYNPATDEWTDIADSPLTGRRFSSVVWTGNTGNSATQFRMLVWGGESGNTGTGLTRRDEGAVYNPATDTWTSMAAVPSGFEERAFHSTVWDSVNGKLIVWGGVDDEGTLKNDGAAYNPSNNTWELISTTNVPVARRKVEGVFTGSKMIVWGGDRTASGLTNTGGVFTPGSSWGARAVSSASGVETLTTSSSGTSTTNAPAARETFTVVWTGSEMIVWGGLSSSSTALNTGARYMP